MRDNVTGLEWQQASGPSALSIDNAYIYCSSLRSGGYDDWRLPTYWELIQLVDHGRIDPCINTNFFSAYSEPYWTYTYNGGSCGTVHFDYLRIVFYNTDWTQRYRVRAVRGAQANMHRYINNGNGTITDRATGLMWQQASTPIRYTWEQSIAHCETRVLAGFDDWRLPSINEFTTLFDPNILPQTNYTSAIDPTYFQISGVKTLGQDNIPYWTSTALWDQNAYKICTYAGITTEPYYDMSGAYYPLAVRGGQCGAFGDLDGDGIAMTVMLTV